MIWPNRNRSQAQLWPAIWPLLTAFLISNTGCASQIRSAMIGSLFEDVSTAVARHDDPALAASGLPTLLLLREGMLEDSPRDRDLLLSAAEAYTSYAALIESDQLSVNSFKNSHFFQNTL